MWLTKGPALAQALAPLGFSVHSLCTPHVQTAPMHHSRFLTPLQSLPFVLVMCDGSKESTHVGLGFPRWHPHIGVLYRGTSSTTAPPPPLCPAIPPCVVPVHSPTSAGGHSWPLPTPRHPPRAPHHHSNGVPHLVVGEGRRKGEPAPCKVEGGNEGVHVFRGSLPPSEEAPGVGVAGPMMHGDLREHHGVGGVAWEDMAIISP